MYRQKSLKFLLSSCPEDFALCRRIESLCHSASLCVAEYEDRILRATFNLEADKSLREEVVTSSDSVLSENTIIGRIRRETKLRTERFEKMLQEKYEALDDQTFQTIVRCRRCGNTNISWDEKQTRGADEACSLFCVCTVCNNRWVVR